MGLFTFVRLLDFLSDVMGTRIDLATPAALRPEMRDEILAEAVVPSDRPDRRRPGYEERQAKLRFRDWRFRVRDILAAVRAIARYTDGMTSTNS